MEKYIILLNLSLCLLVSGCITEYVATGVKKTSDILVVEGMITDDETHITLSRSVNINSTFYDPIYVNDANVYVECDDGTQWEAEPRSIDYWMNPFYNGQ